MKILPYIITAFLGFGCAAKKMAAQNADVVLESQIEKRIPLYPKQKKNLSTDVNKFLNEQKEFTKEAMPMISAVELDVSKVDQQYDRLNSLYRKLALNFSKLMSKYMAPLDEKQQKEFYSILQDDNEKIAELKNSERMEKIYDRFENLFGTITDEQKKIFKDQKEYLIERDALRLKRREKLHSQFRDIYQLDVSPEGRENYFVDAFTNYQDSYPDSPKNKELIKKILPTLSGKQKEEFKEKTSDLKEILGHYLDTDY